MNAKKELLRLDGQIKCATIMVDTWTDKKEAIIILKVDYNEVDYIEFLSELNFEYDNGYGGQELLGTIWFEDGAWAERGEYDGSEWWEIKSLPDIPKELTN